MTSTAGAGSRDPASPVSSGPAGRPAADPRLAALARPSGGLAMLAVDQREALRAMLAATQARPVSDAQLTDFKLTATRLLTPHASAVLLDRPFVLDRALDEGAVQPGCAVIAAADHFVPGPGPGEHVGEVRIDRAVDPAGCAASGVRALKLLVLHRPDEPPAGRLAMVEEFVGRCHDAGLLAIIEPISRPPRSAGGHDREGGILAAAHELGSRGADLYKGEVPLHGRGTTDELRRACARLHDAIASPWVVLSSGVAPDDFPGAVRAAVLAGASGFLAGRAVWRSCVGAADLAGALLAEAVPRLRLLARTVDDALAER